MHTYENVCMHSWKCMCAYACVYVHIYVCLCVCVCVCVCVVHPGEVLASIISLPACRHFKLIHMRTAEQTDLDAVPHVNAKRVSFSAPILARAQPSFQSLYTGY